MIYRYATLDDMNEIMNLYKSAIGTDGCTWREEYPNATLCKKDIETECLLCVEDNNEIIAALSYDDDAELDAYEVWNRKLGKTREIARVVVKDKYQSQGIARKMILKAMDELKRRGYKAVHFLVSPYNTRAVKAYAKLNFDKAGECDYDGFHWYAYEKSLFYIEKTITGDFKYSIWNKFIEAIKKYDLIHNGDAIAVCISGGKDSMLVAKLMQMLVNNKMYDISLKYIMMNPGYDAATLTNVQYNAALFGIDLEIFDTNVFDDTDEIGKNPCFFCSRMRRGYLYRKAKELGCNKIALGHHYDDVIETILMGMLYGSQIQTMLPEINSDNVEGIKLIRPLYLIRENDILNWKNHNKFEFTKCACRLGTKDGAEDTTRLKIKKLIQDLTNDNDAVPANIFGSVQNVDLTKIMSCQIDGETKNAWKNN